MIRTPIAALLFVALLATPAGAAQCGCDFSGFISSMSLEAAAAGITGLSPLKSIWAAVSLRD